MPKPTDVAEVLAHSKVQHAIGDLIVEAARLTGIADKHSQKMRFAIVERIAQGSPIASAIKLVEAVQEATLNVD